MHGDALSLDKIPDNSISKIITDPPWGIFQKTTLSLVDFYFKMLKEFLRVLKKNGMAVILIGQPEIFEDAMEKCSGDWDVLGKYRILVSGQKAVLYKLRVMH